MRFTIKPESGEPIILRQGDAENKIGFFLVDSMVEGWFGTPAPREQVKTAVGHDGDLEPESLTQGSRVVTFYGAIEAESHVESANAKNRLNALFGQKLEIIGEDADGIKRCFGYLSDDPQPKYLPGMKLVKFSLVITCPYPRKIGNEITFQAANGVCCVTNNGNAPTFPKIVVSSRITSLVAHFDGHIFSWRGNSSNLMLDTFDASTNTGEIVNDDAFEIPPGEHNVYLLVEPSNAKVSIVLAPAWR